MDRPWQGIMDLGIVQAMAFPEAAAGERNVLDSALRIAGDPFFNVIEICHVKEETTRRELKQMFEIAGVEVGFAAQLSLLSKNMATYILASASQRARTGLKSWPHLCEP